MEISKFEKLFLDQMSEIFDVDSIIKEIKSRNVSDCNFLSDADVKYAFMQWLKHHFESIENDASYFIRENSKYFDKSLLRLEQDKLQVEDYDDGFPKMSDEEFAQMAIDMNPNYNSALEDDFDGTPEEVAESAIYW